MQLHTRLCLCLTASLPLSKSSCHRLHCAQHAVGMKEERKGGGQLHGAWHTAGAIQKLVGGTRVAQSVKTLAPG